MYTETLNPRRASRSRQYRSAKVRQGARWDAAQLAVAMELERRFLATDQAWRRWQAQDRV